MRILIDLQGGQSGSRHRGIGRYSKALAKAIVKNRGIHDVFILLSDLFSETIDEIRRDLSAVLPAERVLVFSAPGPVEGLRPGHSWRMQAAELIREKAIYDIAPDVLLITSLFEGGIDNAVTSVGNLHNSVKTAIVLYDLIPYLDPDRYVPDPIARAWYYKKIESLRRADLLLPISDSARGEAIGALGFDGDRAATIFSAADDRFTANNVSQRDHQAFFDRVGIKRKFVMHTSAFEPRKNFEGLVRAFGLLPKTVRQDFQLVLVAAISQENQIALRRLADQAGLGPDEMVFAGHVPDKELVALYALCTLFVFPPFHEGFGLPALEAMCCGAAVIGSNVTSIPEVIGRADALFDPYSDESIAQVMGRALTDKAFYKELKAHAAKQSKVFSWDRSARLALRAMEELKDWPAKEDAPLDSANILEKIGALAPAAQPSQKDWMAAADSITLNNRMVRRWKAEWVKNLSGIVAEVKNVSDDDGTTTEARSGPDVSLGPIKNGDFEELRTDVWDRNDRIRILLLKLDHIGDFIVTLDGFRLIRDSWPRAHITLVCGPWNKGIAEKSGLFDDILCCEFFPQVGADYDEDALKEHGPAKFRKLPLGSYDLAVDMRYYGDSRILLRDVDAKYRAGYSAPGTQFDLLDLALPEISDTAMKAQVGARVTALAAAVVSTFRSNSEEAREALLAGRPPFRSFPNEFVVGIAPGSGNAIRAWGRERFAELARLLHEKASARFVLFGTERDRSDTGFITGTLPSTDYIDRAGTLGIPDLAPVIAGLDLLIGLDTGTTHMAAAMGVPTLCLYAGQSDVNTWRPIGKHVVTLLRRVDCAPCHIVKIERCTRDRWCMGVSPERVLTAALELRKRSQPSYRV